MSAPIVADADAMKVKDRAHGMGEFFQFSAEGLARFGLARCLAMTLTHLEHATFRNRETQARADAEKVRIRALLVAAGIR